MEERTNEIVVSYPEAIIGLGVVLQKLNEALAPYDATVMLFGSAPDTEYATRAVTEMAAQIRISYDPRKVRQDIQSLGPPSEDRG
jgi:hypothetical protein